MPVHPMLVHFPIALFTSYIIFEILWMIFQSKEWLRNSSLLILGLGIIFAIPTLISGEQSAEFIENIEKYKELVETHETFAKLTTATFAITFTVKIMLLRLKKLNFKTNLIPFMISILGFYFLVQTGLKGGELVYKHGAGIFF